MDNSNLLLTFNLVANSATVIALLGGLLRVGRILERMDIYDKAIDELQESYKHINNRMFEIGLENRRRPQ